MVHFYGIPNCDTVKKARAWLTEAKIDYQFHDFKKLGVPPDHLDRWLASAGWQKVVNRQGQMWRKMDAEAQALVCDLAGARAALLAQPSLIKRPVVEWSDAVNAPVTVGFEAAAWRELASQLKAD